MSCLSLSGGVCVLSVCAHLAAHRENVEGRNGDFAKIIQQTLFVDKAGGDVVSGSGETSDAIRKCVVG